MSDAIKQKKLGMLALAAFLIGMGANSFIGIGILSTILAVVAIIAGVLLLLDM